ncbi:DUF6730 family protein [Flagellimonas taeanensis]|uniref:DUF6730 family protein n=1 Tax=Flagellimonas taeanensis TaxID=1005926 RepID=UPI003AAD63B3
MISLKLGCRKPVLKISVSTPTLRIDNKEINTLLKEYSNNQKKMMENQQKFMQRILHIVEKFILLPSWVIKLSWGLLVCILIGYWFLGLSGIKNFQEGGICIYQRMGQCYGALWRIP